jgi:O-antigen/teichoic acid export membrane protein
MSKPERNSVTQTSGLKACVCSNGDLNGGAGTDHGVAADLKRKSVHGAAATAVGQCVRFLLRFGSTAVLARYLTPDDYGLVAMSGVIVGFAGMFKDMGLSSATVQRDQITQQQISNLFWINLVLGVLIALALIAMAPLISNVYGDSRIAGITGALSLTFIFGGLSLQHQALLRRGMQFVSLAALEISSSLIGVAVGVVLAIRFRVLGACFNDSVWRFGELSWGVAHTALDTFLAEAA